MACRMAFRRGILNRRAFLGVVGGGLLFAAKIARAQPIRTLKVIGILHSSPAATLGSAGMIAIRKGLGDLGYVEGRTIALEFRSAGAEANDLTDRAAELVRLDADVIVAIGPTAVRAAAGATSVLPIVAMDLETDPVASGFARNLRRPGGNVTGLFMDADLAGAWLALLRAVVPLVRNVGVLWDVQSGSTQLTAVQAAARRVAVDVRVLETRSAADLDGALGAGLRGGAKALIVLSSPLAGLTANSKRIAVFAATNRLPAISPFRSFTEAGGLMSYGPNILDVYANTSTFVDKILKGASPGDLPIELPNCDLAINRDAAKALGVAIPPSLRAEII